MNASRTSRGARVTLLVAAVAAGLLYALSAIDAGGMGWAWEAIAWMVAAVGTSLATALAARAAAPRDRPAAILLASVPFLWCASQLIWQAESLVGGGTTLGVAELIGLASVAPLLAWLVTVGSSRADRRVWLVLDLLALTGALAAITLALLGPIVDGAEPVRALVTLALPALYLATSIGGVMTMMGLDLRREEAVPFASVLGALALVSLPWLVWMTATTPVPVALPVNALVPAGYLLLGAGAIHIRPRYTADTMRARDLERRRAFLPLTAVWVATGALAAVDAPRLPSLSTPQLALTLLAVAAVVVRQALLLRERDKLLAAETESRATAETARRQALAAMRDTQAALDRLAEAEERYRSLVERIPAVVYLDRIDPSVSPERDGYLGSVYFGPQAGELLGVDPARLVADPDLWDQLIHPDDEEAAFQGTRDFYRTGTPLDQTYRMIRPDGRVIWINQRAELLGPDADGRYLAQGVVIDVTEHRTAEERLREAAKLEAVGRLAGGVAHDFNNLLTIISGYASLLREQLAADDPRREEVAAIERAAGTAASLVAQLLAYGRRQMASHRVLDLGQLTREALPMLTRVVGERVEVRTEIEPDVPAIRADPAQIEQVIMNLVLNANDAMPHGGRLDVRVQARLVGDDEARSRPGLRSGMYAELVVHDTGVGMDDATRRRVFEPFFTTKPAGHGNGLGLASVYGIVRQSDGDIWVNSAPGVGSTFRVLLPVADPQPGVASAATGDRASPVAGGIATLAIGGRILLVEDEPGVRALATTVLRRAGYDVVTAASGDEALRALAAMPVRPDLLLSDVMMPGMTGPELAVRVRAADPEMAVLFMSGYAEDAIGDGQPLGGNGFIAKPFQTAALLDAVSALLDGAQPSRSLRSSEPPAA